MMTDIGVTFIRESENRAETARGRINHCLDQLGNDDMWWTPGEECNSIGVIIQHLFGNLRQWIIAGIGGEPDIRDRPREFEVAERSPKAEIQARFNTIIDQVLETFSRLSAEELLEMRTIQGLDRSVLGAIYGTITHLELHAGQISYVTRLRLGSAYDEFRPPAGKAQGR